MACNGVAQLQPAFHCTYQAHAHMQGSMHVTRLVPEMMCYAECCLGFYLAAVVVFVCRDCMPGLVCLLSLSLRCVRRCVCVSSVSVAWFLPSVPPRHPPQLVLSGCVLPCVVVSALPFFCVCCWSLPLVGRSGGFEEISRIQTRACQWRGSELERGVSVHVGNIGRSSGCA